MKMRNHRIILGVLALALTATSCADFLAPYPSAIRDEEYVLNSSTAMQGLVDQCYEYMSKNYNNNEGAYLDCATDNAVRASRTDVLSRIAVGVTLPSNDPFQTYWDRDYKGIYNCNLFIKDENGRKARYMLDEHFDETGCELRIDGFCIALDDDRRPVSPVELPLRSKSSQRRIIQRR